MIETLKGKRTYLTVIFAALYLAASKSGWVEYSETVVQAFELIAIGFLRSAVAKPSSSPTIITPNTDTK